MLKFLRNVFNELFGRPVARSYSPVSEPKMSSEASDDYWDNRWMY